MLEKQIEKLVCDYARARGVYVRKFTSPAHLGVPDRLFIYAGRVFFIEFKAKGKKATPAQERELAAIRSAGADAFVVDSVDEGKAIIYGMMDGHGDLGTI